MQPFASGSLIAMEVALDTAYEYRLRLTVKPFGENQAVQFSYHTAPSSGGTPIGWGVSIPSLSTDDPSLPGVDTASAVFMVNAAGTYWVIAKAFEIGAATGWVRYDDFVLERRLMEECLSVAGPDVEICQGDTVQVGTGCLPSPHPLDSLEYCYRWMPETGLNDPENAMPHASPEQTVTYRVYVTASDGELVAEDEVTVTVNTVEVRILPEDPSLCYRDMPGARPGRNAAPTENRAVGCTQEYVVLSLGGAYATAEWSTGITGDSIEVYEPGLYSVSVTVANLNDTDGDTIPDYQDMSVTASLVGRNEIYLMKLLVLKPQPYSGGSLKLRVLEGGQRVKFWKAPTKEDSLASASPNEYNISFGNAPDSLTFYLEATGHSDTLRDIVIEASYGGKRDTVAATAFWVGLSTVWFNRTISPQPTFVGADCNNCPYTTTPAPDPAVQLSECGTYRRINCGWIANDMTRYGFGPCRREPMAPISSINFPGDTSSNNKWMAGRIFWEFRILPALTTQQYDDFNLTFDVTRQKQINTCWLVSGNGFSSSNCDQDIFPWLAQQDNEKANDDDGQGGLGQNDNTPSPAGLIYSFDPPGSDLYDIENENLAFKIYRATFKEFVRMKIDDFQTNNISGPKNTLEGSRSSAKMDWYNTFHLRRFSNGLYKICESRAKTSCRDDISEDVAPS
ncbi:MAG: hypothetical protein H6560_19705 [Lewinellaceae bacterium]|nr:hypothetical protein [Lewinellaceae bacterium]